MSGVAGFAPPTYSAPFTSELCHVDQLDGPRSGSGRKKPTNAVAESLARGTRRTLWGIYSRHTSGQVGAVRIGLRLDRQCRAQQTPDLTQHGPAIPPELGGTI